MKPLVPLRLACFFAANLAASLHAASVLEFAVASFTVAENVGQATLTVQRANDVDTPVSVDYATTDGTATNGLKYTATNGTLAFAANETNQSIVVPILNNGLVEGTKNFRVILSNPDGGAVLGTRTNVLVSITDNDSLLKVEFASYEAREDEATVVIGVVRGDDGDFPVSVDYATANVTALAGEDYTETLGRLTFASGEKLKLVSIPILNDALNETNKTFRFTLANVIGTTLSAQKSATITLKDNDPGVEFVTEKYYIHEDEGALRVTVRR
ncbi:MAG: hypothetical protein HY706_21010 [Candidatus Hydrogenedentes bacterium]|nr:hypothetical protein [Candidatus Hydrogenedentota bacterium]